MMIEFLEPPVRLSLSDYMKLVELWKKAGSCAAFCIRLGHLFFTEGVNEVDNEIQPLLSNIIKDPNTLSPRVLPSYAILYWFALKVIWATSFTSLHAPACMYVEGHFSIPSAAKRAESIV
jgi:hypothetical protein